MLRNYNKNILLPFLIVLSLVLSPLVMADDQDEVMAVVDAYLVTETDLAEQSKLMTEDRTYIVGAPAMRHTDNVANMKMQLAGEKRRNALDPEGLLIVTAEDKMVRTYGDAAVASFTRHMNWRPSAEAVRSGSRNNTTSHLVTLVLAKVDSDWKIVHTHISLAR